MKIIASAILMATFAMAFCSCGKKFDTERAKQLTEAYENKGLTEDEWNEYGDMYINGADYLCDIYDQIESKVTPEMTVDEVYALDDEYEDIFDTWHDMKHTVYDGMKQMPDGLTDKCDVAEKKVHDKQREIEAKIAEKNPTCKDSYILYL